MQADTYYHIYNHANGSENLFREKDNYRFFMEKWTLFIEPIARTCAYCLMPNHFHFLIRTRSTEKILETIESLHQTSKVFKNLGGLKEPGSLNDPTLEEKTIIQPFSNLFNSYSKAYNKKYNRRGSLFIPKFKRNEIDSDEYFTTIVHYIHHNPIHHGFCNYYSEWPYSSYKTILSEKPSKLDRETILDWFGGREEFVKFHLLNIQLPSTSNAIEKFGFRSQ